MCEFIEQAMTPPGDGTRKKSMLLVPRGCYKSTLASIAMPILLLARNPELRILIDSHKHEESAKALAAIKWHLEKNRKLIDLVGDWKVGATQWAFSAITIGPKTRATKDPSIAIGGVNASKTGGHFDIILCDDLQNEENAESESGRRKVKAHLDEMFPILDPNGCLLVIGTRWHFADVYASIIESDRKLVERGQDPEWKKLIRSCWLPNGTPYFPSKLDAAAIDQLQRSISDRHFAVWYLNEPIEEGAKTFPKAWWRYFEGDFLIQDYAYVKVGQEFVPVYVTMAVDPAVSSRRRADFTGITVVGTDPEGSWYVLEAQRVKGGPEKVIDAILMYVRQYWPRVVAIETIAFQEALRLLLLKRFKEEGVRVQIYEYKESLRARKTSRIEGLQPLFKQRKMFLRKGLGDLYTELDQYPELEHDDLLDSLSQHLAISNPQAARRPVVSIDLEDREEDDEDERTHSHRHGTWIGKYSQTRQQLTIGG